MKITKRFCLLLLALVMIAGMCAGCAPKEDPAQEPTDQTAQPDDTQTPAEPTSDEKFDYSAGLDDNGFWKDVKALDLVTLPDYKNIKIPADVHTVTDEAVDAEVANLMAEFTTMEKITDRAVADGDTVNIDYVGSVDGVAFDGGSTQGMGTLVTLGVTQYIDDFLQQLIGHKPGETFDINVTFPADYGVENLNGKDAVFVTTVNYIEGGPVESELTDAYVAENLTANYGWTTVAEMRDAIRKQIEEQAVGGFMQEYVLANAVVSEVPQAILDFERGSIKAYYTQQAAYAGADLDTYLQAAGMSSIEDLYEASKQDIEDNAKFALIVQAIAEDGGITVTDEDMVNFFADQFGITEYEQYIAAYGKPYFKMATLSYTVFRHLTENAVKE